MNQSLMRKKFLRISMLSCLVAASSAGFYSCKDYDGDIARLTERIDLNEEAIKSIESLVQNGSLITSVEPADDGVIITLSNGQQFKISNGTTAEGGTVWTIVETADGYFWAQNGNVTQYPAQGPQGEKGDQGDKGDQGPQGDTGTAGIYYVPNPETGCFDIYNGDGTFKESTNISWKAGDGSSITAVDNGVDIIIIGLHGADGKPLGPISLSKSGMLRSMVFDPQFYYHGIEAMRANTYVFDPLKINEVNADADNSKDAPVASGSPVQLTPALQADYFLNPSCVNPKYFSLDNLSFVSKDMEYTRANNNTVQPRIYKYEIKDGKISVWANYNQGAVKDIEQDGQVSVIALRAKMGSVKSDSIVTSDFAAIKQVTFTDLNLYLPAKNPQNYTVANTTPANIWYKSAQEAIAQVTANSTFLCVAWNETIDLAQYIQTHYVTEDKNGVATAKVWDADAASGTVEKSGFKYNYELVGYKMGSTGTQESAQAAIKGSILRPQMPSPAGKQQPWGADQNVSTVGRVPLVRVSLVDTISAPNRVAAVCYVPVRITKEPSSPQGPNVKELEGFSSVLDYTLGCKGQMNVDAQTWANVQHKLFAAVNMDAAQFESTYKMSSTSSSATEETAIQYTKKGDTFQPANVNETFGKIFRTTDNTSASETQVLKWEVETNQAYEYFKNTGKKSVTVYIRYELRQGKSAQYQYLYVPFTWTPGTINDDPHGEIADSDKIKNYWYNSWSNVSGYDEFHVNVKQPEVAGSIVTDFSLAVTDVFVGNKFTIRGINPIYKDYNVNTLNNTVRFSSELAQTEATGVSGVKYLLSVSSDGTKLSASYGGTTQVIATVDPTTSMIRYEYSAQPSFAKDILNYAKSTELAKNQTIAAKLNIQSKNTCNDYLLPLSGDKFNVRFLRPVNINTVNEPSFVDAGKDIEESIAKYFDFTDWRNFAFKSNPGFWNYYMGSNATIKVGKYTGGKLDSTTSGDITKYATTTLNGGNLESTKLTDITTKLKLSYENPATFSLNDMGKILYHNAGMTINTAFQVRIPFIISYTWGDIQVYLDVTIKPTINQSKRK